jgi:hypothetical protein
MTFAYYALRVRKFIGVITARNFINSGSVMQMAGCR